MPVKNTLIPKILIYKSVYSAVLELLVSFQNWVRIYLNIFRASMSLHSFIRVEQWFQLTEPLWTDAGIKSGISVCELIST